MIAVSKKGGWRHHPQSIFAAGWPIGTFIVQDAVVVSVAPFCRRDELPSNQFSASAGEASATPGALARFDLSIDGPALL